MNLRAVRSTLRRAAVTALVAVFAAGCGGAPIGAVVGSGRVSLRAPGADAANLPPGATPFGNGASLTARDGPATVRIAVGAALTEASAATGVAPRGTLDVTLADGAAFRRRQGTVFDLLDGSLDIAAGPLARRVVVFCGDVFLELHETADANGKGVRLHAAAGDGTLTVRVEHGEVLLHAPVATPRDLHYVKLTSGESATARAGERPEKDAAGSPPDPRSPDGGE